MSLALLVCGGRYFDDQPLLNQTLDAIEGVTLVIHGGASGADYLAGCWAHRRGIPIKEFPADWKRHGKAAGPIRNKAMLVELVFRHPRKLVVAFPGGRGTANMVSQARLAHLKVQEVTRER